MPGLLILLLDAGTPCRIFPGYFLQCAAHTRVGQHNCSTWNNLGLASGRPASRKGRCASREIVPRGTIVGPAIQASTSHGNGEIVPRGTIVLVDTLVRPDLRRITPVCTTLRASQRAGRMHRPAQFSAMWRAFLCTVVTDTLANGRGYPLTSSPACHSTGGAGEALLSSCWPRSAQIKVKERSSFFAVEDVHLVFVVAGAGDLFGRNGGFEVSDLS